MVAAASSPWRKRLLALFAALALAGLAVGLVAVFKPEAYGKLKTQAEDTVKKGLDHLPLPADFVIPGDGKAKAEATTTTPTSTDEAVEPVVAAPAEPAVSAAPAEPAVPAAPVAAVPADKPLPGLVKNANADLLSGLLNAQDKGPVASSTTATTQANASADQQKEKAAFLQQLVQATSVKGAASLQGGCTPIDGLDLRRMVEDPTACTVITLQPGKMYNVAIEGEPDDVTVRSRKVIIGNPVFLPTIDGTTAKRIFHVVAGGSLDLQFVRTYRGSGEAIATIPVLRGGTVLIELGGRFSAFGVIFTNAPPTGIPAVLIAPDISRAVRVFGGQIFNAGGIMTITLSHFWVLAPGVLLRELYIVGGDILMVAGVTVLSGCTFTNSQLFLNGFGVGYFVAVLGGVLISSGVTYTVNMLAINVRPSVLLPYPFFRRDYSPLYLPHKHSVPAQASSRSSVSRKSPSELYPPTHVSFYLPTYINRPIYPPIYPTIYARWGSVHREWKYLDR